jgi:ribosomal peptide maturation radical SAM protein 1
MTIPATDVLLVSMPWAVLHSPSIQIGTLQALLEQNGFSATSRHYYLDAAEYFINLGNAAQNEFTCEDYRSIAGQFYQFGLGDWIFAVPPYKDITPEDDENYRRYLTENPVPEKIIEKAFLLRDNVGELLNKWVADILSVKPKIVGFTSSFSQNVPSLVLAKMIKIASPETHIIFGGANCDGPMGEALIKTFSWVDTVFRGEAEKALPAYLNKIIRHDDSVSLEKINGLCFRTDSEIHIIPQTSVSISMDEVPLPNYNDYFEQVKTSSLSRYIVPRLAIPFESARGCWWGEKHHCTFCGLNGTSMAFRSKTAKRVYDEILNLGSKYHQTNFSSVDNIISMDHVRDLLPELRKLREEAYDCSLFYETKVNLKKEQIELLRDAGVRRVQPGIESLSTPILRLMLKGTTALQNIRFLKWAEQYGITPHWNIIYGFPGEPIEEYDKMAKLVSSLTHLPPPNFTHLGIQRFSPYHNEPEKFGLKLKGPVSYYKFIYQTDEATLKNLAYDFEFSYSDDKQLDYVEPLKAAVRAWRRDWKSRSGFLHYERGLDFLRISDNRPNLNNAHYTFKKTEAEIYLACDAGATPEQIRRHLSASLNINLKIEEIEAFLIQLVNSKLIFKEGDVYLSLAVPRNRDARMTGREVRNVVRSELPVFSQ